MRVIRATAVGIALCLAAACEAQSSPAPADSAEPAASGAAVTSAAPGAPLRLVFDTDMAPDDVVAMASLLRDPDVEVLAILVDGTGEAHCPGGMFVARSVVTMLVDAQVPVACGRSSPIGDAEPFPAEWRAGADVGNGINLVSPAYAPDPRPAPDLLVELAAAEAAAGNRLTVLTTGTLTNIADAVELDPSLPEKVRIISMLGAVGVPGNVFTQGTTSPTAEWNAHADPTAVARVLAAGFDLTLVPLDATRDVPLTQELFETLSMDHVAGPADLVFEIYARNPFMLQGEFHLWDPLAAVALRDPSVVTWRTARVRVVEGAGVDGGRLVEDPNGAAVTYAASADRARFEAFLLDRLRIGPPRDNDFGPKATVTVTASAASCEVRLDPAEPQAGLLQFEATNPGAEQVSVIAFGLGPVTWTEIEAFVASGPGPQSSPPPVVEVAFAEVAPGQSGTFYGTAPAGGLGVACLTGSFEQPRFTLAGPFTITP